MPLDVTAEAVLGSAHGWTSHGSSPSSGSGLHGGNGPEISDSPRSRAPRRASGSGGIDIGKGKAFGNIVEGVFPDAQARAVQLVNAGVVGVEDEQVFQPRIADLERSAFVIIKQLVSR